MQAPRPEEFGLTEERLDVVDGQLWRVRLVAAICFGVSAFLAALYVFYRYFVGRGSQDLTFDLLVLGLPISIFVGLACGMALFITLLSLPISLWDEHAKVRRYRAAVLDYERRRQRSYFSHWAGLSAKRLQTQVSDLYRKLGYEILPAPAGEAEVVDFVLRKDKLQVVVNCRLRKVPVDWLPVRALAEAQKRQGAERAIVVSIPGFTAKAKRFAVGKPLGLISVPELARIERHLEVTEEGAGSAEPLPQQ